MKSGGVKGGGLRKIKVTDNVQNQWKKQRKYSYSPTNLLHRLSFQLARACLQELLESFET